MIFPQADKLSPISLSVTLVWIELLVPHRVEFFSYLYLLTEKIASSNPSKVTSKLSLQRGKSRNTVLRLSQPALSQCFLQMALQVPPASSTLGTTGWGRDLHFAISSPGYSETTVEQEHKYLLNHFSSLKQRNSTLKNMLQASAQALSHKRWADCNPHNRRCEKWK